MRQDVKHRTGEYCLRPAQPEARLLWAVIERAIADWQLLNSGAEFVRWDGWRLSKHERMREHRSLKRFMEGPSAFSETHVTLRGILDRLVDEPDYWFRKITEIANA